MAAIPMAKRWVSCRWLRSSALPIIAVALALVVLWHAFDSGNMHSRPIAVSSSHPVTSVKGAAVRYRPESAQQPIEQAGTASRDDQQRFLRFLLLYGASTRPFAV